MTQLYVVCLPSSTRKAVSCEWYLLSDPLHDFLTGEVQYNCKICLAYTASLSCCLPSIHIPKYFWAYPTKQHKGPPSWISSCIYEFLDCHSVGGYLSGWRWQQSPSLRFPSWQVQVLHQMLEWKTYVGMKNVSVCLHLTFDLFMAEWKKPQRGEKTPWEHYIARGKKPKNLEDSPSIPE